MSHWHIFIQQSNNKHEFIGLMIKRLKAFSFCAHSGHVVSAGTGKSWKVQDI